MHKKINFIVVKNKINRILVKIIIIWVALNYERYYLYILKIINVNHNDLKFKGLSCDVSDTDS